VPESESWGISPSPAKNWFVHSQPQQLSRMTGQAKTWGKTAIACVAILLFMEGAIAQGNSSLPPLPDTTPLPSPDPPPPLTAQQSASMEKFVKDEIRNSDEVGNRVREEIDRTFGWTIGLLNTLIAVLVAIPILTGLAAFWLRRIIIGQAVQDIKKELELVREELKVQAAKDLKDQLATFEQELAAAKLGFTNQLQTLSITAQQEKDLIFQELAKITPLVIQEEFVAPEIQEKIKALTEQLEALKSQHSLLMLSPDDYLNQGNAFYLETRYEDAIASYEKALEFDPTLVDAWLGKAKASRKLKRYEVAIAANDRAIQLQPDNASAWFGKGYALSDLQKYKEADAAYAQAIQLNPDASIFWRHRAFVLIKLGDHQEAWLCLEKALETEPNSSHAHCTKAFYYASQNQPELALASIEEAVRLNPDEHKYPGYILVESAFELLQADDRFQQLIGDSSDSPPPADWTAHPGHS
jgi:tetratricopeptide (TPR) repeat protein